MNDGEERKLERTLESLALKPALPGLRERVLDAARKEREERAWTTPLLRACLAGCAVILIVIFALDGVASSNQARRLQALLDGNRMTGVAADTEWASLVKDLSGVLSPAELAREKRLLARQGRTYHGYDFTLIKDFLKEDHDGSEIPKDPD